ncbi:WD repeat-containing protein 6, partial [Coemansia sp. RSA 2598]
RDGRELVSASDDRTLRLWDLGRQGDEHCLAATLFGHQARVWTGVALKNYVVGASEDGTCRVWARDAKGGVGAVDIWKQCKKNVWAMAVNESERLVVSGAADGSVCVWSMEAVSGRRLQSTDSLDAIDLPVQPDYLPSMALARRSEHIRNFALLGTTDSGPTDIVAVMDSGCVLEKPADEDWRLLCHLPGLVGYSMLASTRSGSLVAVGMRDGSVALFGSSVATLGAPPLSKLHGSSIQRLHVAPVQDAHTQCQSEMAFDLITSDSDRMVVWSRIHAGAAATWRVMASFRLPGRTRLATAAVDSVLGWMAIGSQNGGIYLFDLPEALCGLSAQSPLDGFALATADAPVLDMAVYWAQAHGDADITSIILHGPSQTLGAESQFSLPKQSMLVTSGRDGTVQRFEILAGNRAQRATAGASTLHLRAGSTANGAADSRSAVCVRRKSIERITAGSIGAMYEISGQLYAVTFYRNRMVLVDVADQMDMFSVAFAERDRRWRVHCMGGDSGSILHLGFINKMQVLKCSIDLRSHMANYRLAPGVSSLDIRGVSAAQIAGSNGWIVALGGEDCVLRICEIDGRLLNPIECLTQALRHSSAIRSVLFVPDFNESISADNQAISKYLLTAGASCELRCWRLDIDRQSSTTTTASLLEWTAAPVLSDDCESRIMDLAIVDVSEDRQAVLVAAAYSDASICLWRLDLANNKFVCVARDPGHAHGCCVLSLSYARVAGAENSDSSSVSVLLSGGTDGRVLVWDLTELVSVGYCPEEATGAFVPRELGVPVAAIDAVHQSGVNTMDTRVMQEGSQIAVASGGDDNSISVFTLSCADLLSRKGVVGCDVRRYENAHASSVQQLRFVDDQRLWSVATDQRIVTWSVDGNGIVMVAMECTQVADPSAMVLLPTSLERHGSDGDVCALVAGIGMETFRMKQ